MPIAHLGMPLLPPYIHSTIDIAALTYSVLRVRVGEGCSSMCYCVCRVSVVATAEGWYIQGNLNIPTQGHHGSPGPRTASTGPVHRVLASGPQAVLELTH